MLLSIANIIIMFLLRVGLAGNIFRFRSRPTKGAQLEHKADRAGKKQKRLKGNVLCNEFEKKCSYKGESYRCR